MGHVMCKKLLRHLLTLVAASVVVSATHQALAQTWKAETRLKLLIKGKDPDSAMVDETQLTATLNEYGVSRPTGASLRQWINAIRNANGGQGAATLAGPGGIQARSLLNMAEETLSPGNGPFQARPGAVIAGQIESFLYDSATKNGNIVVTVFTTITKGASGMTKTKAERFTIAVNGGFEVEEKNPTDPDNVFPVAAVATGLQISSATASGFEWKLYASGSSIRVVQIERDNNYNPASPNFHTVNNNAAKYKKLFETDPNACIDMMFAGPPPAVLPTDAKPPYYCLGRCKSPPIINTR